MVWNKKVSDKILIESYKRLGSVHKVGKEVGLNHSSVHERLVKLNLVNKINVFSKEDIEILKREYLIYRDAGKLNDLAKKLKRTKFFICRQAKYLGLTNRNRKARWLGTWKYMSFEIAEILFNKFKKSSLGLGQFCKRNSFDNLGFSRTMKKFFADEYDYVIELKTPKQTKYRLGRQFEYRVRDDMRKKNYFVLRSPRSGSPVDLVCIKKGKIVFIQCKKGGQFPPIEWNEFYELCQSVGATPILASTPKGRGIEYYLLVGLKDRSKKPQPYKLLVTLF